MPIFSPYESHSSSTLSSSSSFSALSSAVFAILPGRSTVGLAARFWIGLSGTNFDRGAWDDSLVAVCSQDGVCARDGVGFEDVACTEDVDEGVYIRAPSREKAEAASTLSPGDGD